MVIDGTTEPVVSQELGTLQWLVLLFPRPAVAAVTGTLVQHGAVMFFSVQIWAHLQLFL